MKNTKTNRKHIKQTQYPLNVKMYIYQRKKKKEKIIQKYNII